MDEAYARNIVSSTPCLDKHIESLTVGTEEEPDIVLSITQPETAMRLINQWQCVKGAGLSAEVSTFMAVCGSVAVRAYLTGELCLSFGCADSRDYGKISRDRLIVGMPVSLAEIVLQKASRRQHNDAGPAFAAVGSVSEAGMV